MTKTHNEDDVLDAELDEEAPGSLEFESYYDRDSGAWSLRRIPSSIPQPPTSED